MKKAGLFVRMNLKTQFLTLIILCAIPSHAQFGLQLSVAQPSKAFGYSFKPALSYELVFSHGEVDDRLKLRISLGFHTFKPRQDSFPITAQEYNSGWTIYPGYEKWTPIRCFYFTGGVNFKVLEKNFSPLIGLDLITSINDFSYQTKMQGIANTTYNVHRRLHIYWLQSQPRVLFYCE
jgi:hypothetical protein